MTKETRFILKELREEIHRIEKLVDELIVGEEGKRETEDSQSTIERKDVTVTEVSQPMIERKDVEEEITTLMKELGIPAHLLGYQYIREAVILVLQDEEYVRRITKLLYPTVAKFFKTTPSRVERAIRHAIEVGWQRGNIETIERMFGYTVHVEKTRPVNTEFIATITEEVGRRARS